MILNSEQQQNISLLYIQGKVAYDNRLSIGDPEKQMASQKMTLSPPLMEKPIVVQLDDPTGLSSTRELQFLLFSILTILRGKDNKRPMANKKQLNPGWEGWWKKQATPDMSTSIPFPYFSAANFSCPSDFHACKGWPGNGEIKTSVQG